TRHRERRDERGKHSLSSVARSGDKRSSHWFLECFEACGDVTQNITIARRPLRIFRMRIIAGNPATQLEELRGVVLVRRHRRTKGEEAEILQQIVQFVKRGIVRRPQSIAPSEGIGSECTQTK